MKIVHSYWSKPTRESKDDSEEKVFGGWRSKKFMYMSWAFSCLQARKSHGDIMLVTDKSGVDLLINKLKLPYTSVKEELDIYNTYDKRFWAVGKLHAYKIQEKPFIHIDNDVFIGDRFPDRLVNAGLVGQHLEYDIGQYQVGFVDMLQKKCSIPEVLLEDQRIHGRIKAINAGIFGGNNLSFIKNYVEKAFNFINDNLDRFGTSVAGSSHAIIYEQYLFSALARSENIPVSYYYNDEEAEAIDISDFYNMYTSKKYVHFIGNAKFFWECCRNLEHHLVQEYPDMFEHINNLISKEAPESSVRRNKFQHFRRTTEFLKFALDDSFEGVTGFSFNDTKKLEKWLDLKANRNSLRKVLSDQQCRMLEEIYSIEQEKLRIKDRESDLKLIFDQEIAWNVERDRILNLNFEAITKLRFMVNPYMEVYESYWEWIVRESEFREFVLEEVIAEEASEFYFGFERCGTYDAVTDSNIFEFPLTEFQYIIMRLFEETSDTGEVLASFYAMFEVTTELEDKELKDKVEKILKQLIYRRCIVLDR
ncbi:DUF6734 family protein [Flavobacteriaceae bacterium M23B6Z8]